MGHILLPHSVTIGKEREFVVVAAGQGCASKPGDRVLTTTHPGVPWECNGEVMRIVVEETEVQAIVEVKG